MQLFSLSCLHKAQLLSYVYFKSRYVLCLTVLCFLTFHLLPCCSFMLFFKVPVYFLVLSTALNKTCHVPFPPIPELKCKYYAGSAQYLWSLWLQGPSPLLKTCNYISDLLLFSEFCISSEVMFLFSSYD